MYKRKEDSIAIFYGVNDRFLQIMKTKLPYEWDMYSFAHRMIGNNRRNLTLVSENDSLLVYEIQKGLIHIPAAMVSVYKKSGYSILLYTFGLDKDLHMTIGNFIQCEPIGEFEETIVVNLTAEDFERNRHALQENEDAMCPIVNNAKKIE